ncbi:MAG TPA: TAXI family TRAP transporter solute-binding subunit [Spirochaetia bacterium]|nr:TAXI family TRAP transporter solute-binding subunit [Spirochaetia bacterium]
MNKFGKALGLTLLLCVALGAASAQGAGEIKSATYTWVAGGMGGGWYTVAGGFARLINEKEPKLTIKVIPGGGVANPLALAQGSADIAWGVGYVDKAAFNGTAPIYDKPYKNVASIAGTLAVDYYHFLAAKDTGVTSLEQFVNKIKKGEKLKVAAPMTGTSEFVLTSFVLEHYGVSYDRIKKNGGTVVQAIYGDMTSLFKDRHVDYAFACVGLPGAIMTEMAMGRPSTLLEISDECIDFCNKTYGTVAKASGLCKVPGGTYAGMPKDIQTLCHSTEILVSPKLPDAVAYTLAKLLCENKDFLVQLGAGYKVFDPKSAAGTVQVPLHPGAEKYYREVGTIK